MNGELQVLKTEKVVFPMKHDEIKVSEAETNEIKEIKVSEVRVSIDENRFARLKKSLRKRSVSIL